MTLLKIEVKTVTGKYHPEDMIKIWAPHLRASGDAVVSTAPEIVKLVQGKAQVELLPGPARIQIMCGGTLDNAVRKVTIPDAANATLRAVLEDGFDWEPQIVTEVMRYRNEAVAASTSAAEDAADAANSAADAATSASASATSASEAAASETAASTSATNAATSATGAATSAGEAATHEDTSLDAAAAAIAAAVSVAQFQGHGFPEGQVSAPVGSIYTDLDATNGAIRWIKTSGTGNTGWQVEYGDTGIRNYGNADLAEGWTVGLGFLCSLSRSNSQVTLSFHVSPELPVDNDKQLVMMIPLGFRPAVREVNVLTTTGQSEGDEVNNIIVDWGGQFRRYPGRSTNPSLSIAGTMTWTTNDPWPTILPGTPA